MTLTLEAGVEDGPELYRFRTVDGVVSPEEFRTAELLLLRALHGNDPGEHLSVQANYGVVGVGLAATADSVRLVESSARRATLSRRNAAANEADVQVAVAADLRRLPERYDTASYAPQSHTPIAVGAQRIADALAMLVPGGRLFVAAPAQSGLRRYEDCLRDLAGNCRTALAMDGCAVLVAERPERVDPPRYVRPTTFEVTVDEVDLSLVTVPGMFSTGSLDDGTRLLAQAATVNDGDRVLDLCCGSGPLGIYAAEVADCSVTFSDDSRVATSAATCSLRRSGVDGRVVTADGTAGVTADRFDHILCNPPTHAGSGVLSALLGGVEDVLTQDGRLQLVHHRALDLDAHLRGFETVERLVTGAEHVVLEARTGA
jgi:16S rRNA (guanine1207-N2)-methyltransferase